MSYDPIQGQGQDHGGPKVAKMADFKVYLLHDMLVIKRLTVNSDTPRLILFFPDRFFQFALVRRHLRHLGDFK